MSAIQTMVDVIKYVPTLMAHSVAAVELATHLPPMEGLAMVKCIDNNWPS